MIKDEVNIKEVVFDGAIEIEVEINTEITPELKKEGNYRDLLRAIQDVRKKEGLNPSDEISLTIEVDKEGKDLIIQFENDLKKTVQAREVNFDSVSDGHEIKIDNLKFKIKVKK